jgi:hypothetical protein
MSATYDRPMSKRDCNCATVCPDYDHCGCVYIYEEGRCHCICGPDPAGVVLAGEPVTLKAALDSRVDVTARGASVGELGALLAAVTNAEIFVPASRLDERRELYLEDVSLDTVVRELGLMAVVGP